MKNNIVSILCACFGALLFSFSVHAQPTVEEITSNPSNAVLAEDWGSPIYEAMEEFMATDDEGRPRNWRLGAWENNPNGAYIGWGESSIQLDPADVRYGRARIAAYITAYINAMGDFTRTLGVEISVETLSRVFGDESAAADMDVESTDEFFRALGDRLATLSVAALDRGLERLGADPDQLPRFTRDQKVLLAENLMTREIVRVASARLQGARTLATFEDPRNVGVLIIHHERLEALARRIMAGDEVSREPAQLDELLASIDALSDSELIFQHGLRVLPDAAGRPVILSFGQASPAVSQSDPAQTIRMSISRARQVAEAQADAFVAEFLNATVFANAAVDLTAGEFEIAEQVGRTLMTQRGNQFWDDLNTMIRQVARAEVTGMTTVRRWQANHPDTGHLYLGVVRLWTPSQAFTYSAERRQEILQAERGTSLADSGMVTDEPVDEGEDATGEAPIRRSRELLREDW